MLTSLEFVDADREYDARVQRLAVDLDRLIRRLRSLTRHSWQSRRQGALVLIAELAELSAAAEKLLPCSVPAVPDHTLPDVVAVLSDDLLVALAARPSLELLHASAGAVERASRSTT